MNFIYEIIYSFSYLPVNKVNFGKMTISVKSMFGAIFGFRSPVKMKLGKIIFPIQPASREGNTKKIHFFFFNKRMGTKICLNSAFTSRLRKNLNIRNAHAVGIRSEHSGRAARSPFGLAIFGLAIFGLRDRAQLFSWPECPTLVGI